MKPTTNRRRSRASQLQAEIDRLNAKLQQYQRSIFGCYSRQALITDILPDFDARGFAVIYFDIDGLGKLNATYGKADRLNPDVPSTNERIIASFAALRCADLVFGQWFSGDEFVALVPADDAFGFASRLRSTLADNAITATILIIDYHDSVSVRAAIDAADNLTAVLKKAGLRDRIHDRPATLEGIDNV